MDSFWIIRRCERNEAVVKRSFERNPLPQCLTTHASQNYFNVLCKIIAGNEDITNNLLFCSLVLKTTFREKTISIYGGEPFIQLALEAKSRNI